MQRLNLGDGHPYQIGVKICDLLSIALNGFLRELLFCMFSEKIAQQIRQSFGSGDVWQANGHGRYGAYRGLALPKPKALVIVKEERRVFFFSGPPKLPPKLFCL
jgi:hypothetical protein